MKVIVTIAAQFEVDVDTHNFAHARRAIEANWDAIYKHQARWLHGTAPQLQGGHILGIEPPPHGTANILGVYDGGKEPEAQP